jgi:hypothetical protein
MKIMKSIKLILLCGIFFIACNKKSDISSLQSNNGTGGSTARFTLAGNYLYVVSDAQLKTYDVSNAALPVVKNTLTIGSNIETIYPYKNNLFIGSQNGMFIYSIAKPDQPKLLGSAMHVRSCDPVVANDTAAFVTLRGGSNCGSPQDGLYTYSITNLLQPQLVNTMGLATPYGLGLVDSIAFVCQGKNGLAVVNVKDIKKPTLVKTITGNDFRDVIPYNNLLICYVTDGLALYDITTIANMQLVKKILN